MAFIAEKHAKNTGLKIFLVRHAESMNNIACHDDREHYEQTRSHDPELSQRGMEQAAQLAEYIRKLEHMGEICESKA
jgi:broad specificity phosphatase PhoE